MQIFIRMSLLSFIVARVECTNNSSICGKRLLDETTLLPKGQTLPGQFPWHVSIYRHSYYTCSGSIVSPRLVITLANYLVYTQDSTAYHFTAGLHDLANTSSGIIYNVTEVIVHPEFMQTGWSDDIGLLRSASDISFGESTNVLPICLPSVQTVKGFTVRQLLNKSGILVGWEYPDDDRSSNFLQWKALSVIDLGSCRRKLFEDFHYMLENGMFCAIQQNIGANIFLGDRGGGLAFLSNGIWYLQGLFSFAPHTLLNKDKVGFDQSGVFVFIDVARYITWINEHFIN